MQVSGSTILQRGAGIFALFPFSIGFFTRVTDVSRDHMCTLKEPYCFWLARRAIGCKALGFGMQRDSSIFVRVSRVCRDALYTREEAKLEIVKASEHGLGLYHRPKEGRDSSCDVPVWVKQGWQWILNRALGLPSEDPDWFGVPVMRRIAISTPNVMSALRRLNRDQARPYNFALSPVLVNLSGSLITLLGRFEKNPARWATMPYVNIHDGSTRTLKPPTLPVLAQTFGMAFAQYVRHPESKSLAPDGTSCNGDTCGLLGRYPVTASGFHLIGKETERGWEPSEDMSTLFPSLIHYQRKTTANNSLRERLRKISLDSLQEETDLSRHTSYAHDEVSGCTPDRFSAY